MCVRVASETYNESGYEENVKRFRDDSERCVFLTRAVSEESFFKTVLKHFETVDNAHCTLVGKFARDPRRRITFELYSNADY